MKSLVDFSLNESDKRLLIILLIVMIFLFIIIGLIGALIRSITIRFGKRMDYEVHEVVILRVITTPEQLKKYGRVKNNRQLIRMAVFPFLVGLLSLLIWIIYSTIYGVWSRNYFSEFSTLLFNFDWNNPNNFANFWGLNLLAKWPDLISSPTWYNEYWGSYVLVPLWIITIVWYLVVIQAYLARAARLNKLSHSIFEKSLDDFNYFDDMKAAVANASANKENSKNPQ